MVVHNYVIDVFQGLNVIKSLNFHFNSVIRPVSSPGEFHPQALSEPDLRLSPHPAPIIQPLEALFCPLVPPL